MYPNFPQLFVSPVVSNPYELFVVGVLLGLVEVVLSEENYNYSNNQYKS
jgi:hypothetical protein